MNNFSLLNVKWGPAQLGTPSGTVTWSADLSNGLMFNSSQHTAADFDAALADAFQAWEDVASIDFEFVASGAADIMVSLGPLASPTIGLAVITPFARAGVDGISNVDITLSNSVFWDPTTTSQTEISFFAVAAHEIGHSIGLDHVNDPTQLLNDTLTTDDLGSGDILGAQTIYGRDATDAPRPTGGNNSVTAGDDDGGGGGGIALLLAAIVALIASLFGGGAAGAVALANTEDDGHDDDDHDHHPEDSYGNDLIAFLDLSHSEAHGHPLDENGNIVSILEAGYRGEPDDFVAFF